MATPSTVEASVEAAISRVLNAERSANEHVERATREAAAIVENGRAMARAIAERTDRRLRRLRAAFEIRGDRAVGAIGAQALAEAAAHDLAADDLARLERAVAVVCAELIGDTP
jgi:vacuolar-type H+-ATPase subunit H